MKKLLMTESLRVAHKVLNLIRLSDAAAANAAQVTGYENGREHGLQTAITPREKQGFNSAKRFIIWWSQYRSSDAVVVYVGEPGSWVLTEKAYREGKHFGYMEHAKAAAYISKTLNQAVARPKGKSK